MNLKTWLRVLVFSGRKVDWKKHWNSADVRTGGIGVSPGKTPAEISLSAKFVTETLHLTPEDTLLDVGCGDGSFAQMLPCKSVGMDLPEVIKNVPFPAIAGVITNIPTNQHFDKVLVAGVVHYLSPQEVVPALKELRRVGGTVLIQGIPDETQRTAMLSRCTRPAVKSWTSIQWFNQKKLIAQAYSVGFEKVSVVQLPKEVWQSWYTFSLLLS